MVSVEEVEVRDIVDVEGVISAGAAEAQQSLPTTKLPRIQRTGIERRTKLVKKQNICPQIPQLLRISRTMAMTMSAGSVLSPLSIGLCRNAIIGRVMYVG